MNNNIKVRRFVRYALIFLLAGSFALILWITLLSRVGNDQRELYLPFWSYKEIAKGNTWLLKENIENIVLFIPIGVFIACFLHLEWWQTLVLSLGISIVIECSQWLFWLGSLEFDDLLHNSLGALIGALFVTKTPIGRSIQKICKKKDILVIAVLSVALLAIPLCSQWAHTQSMKKFADWHDREDGAENLLVLDGIDGFAPMTDVSVRYFGDGTIKVDGTSENNSWYVLGKITLPPGTYTFTGFPDTENNMFDLELEYLNRQERKYFYLATLNSSQDVSLSFIEETRIRVLVGIHPGPYSAVICYPAIYSEE